MLVLIEMNLGAEAARNTGSVEIKEDACSGLCEAELYPHLHHLQRPGISESTQHASPTNHNTTTTDEQDPFGLRGIIFLGGFNLHPSFKKDICKPAMLPPFKIYTVDDPGWISELYMYIPMYSCLLTFCFPSVPYKSSVSLAEPCSDTLTNSIC